MGDIEIHIKRTDTSKHTLCHEIDHEPMDAIHIHRALTMTSLLGGNTSILESNCILCLTVAQRRLLEAATAASSRIAALHQCTLEAIDEHLLKRDTTETDFIDDLHWRRP